jgi:hypothetical protein
VFNVLCTYLHRYMYLRKKKNWREREREDKFNLWPEQLAGFIVMLLHCTSNDHALLYCLFVFVFVLWWLFKVLLLLNNLTSYFQMTNTIQKKFKVSSTQLLYQSCPYQAMTLFIVGPFLDGLLTNQNVFAFRYTPQVLVRIEPSLLS